ncbi:MAG: membrane protein insertase YidC [Holosporales bacterium]|jgi:YidC/Oxa1 family membrane protein insertase|nr:membrane protein insertase YidC [Holosporales bacterium]
MSETRSALLAFGLCFAILYGFNYLSSPSQSVNPLVRELSEPEKPVFLDSPQVEMPRDEALKLAPRVRIKSDSVVGSICLNGAKLDDWSLAKYKKTTASNSDPVDLLSPSGERCYAEVSWIGHTDKQNVEVPSSDAIWTLVDGEELDPEHPVILEWGDRLKIRRTFSIDKDYMLTITDHVTNNTGADIKIAPQSEVIQKVGSTTSSSVHEGGIGYFDNVLEEISISKLNKSGSGKRLDASGSDGWCGFTNKYWLTAFIIKHPSQVSIFRDDMYGVQRCRLMGPLQSIKDGTSIEFTTQFFAGAKSLRVLDHYRKTYHIKKFDLAVDFGWLYFITKPLFYLLQIIHSFVGNLALAILILTILSKVVLFPTSMASQRSMMKMRDLQPKVTALKKRYNDDKVRLQQELLLLYRREKVSPISGFLPLLIQMPIFFCLYKVFSINIEMRHAPLGLWISDLSAPDPTSLFNLFGLIPWSVPSFLQIGVLPLLMCGTMILQQKLSPQPSEPAQTKMMYIMPILFLFMFSSFPAGLVLYWMISNVLSICQQVYINNKWDNRSRAE